MPSAAVPGPAGLSVAPPERGALVRSTIASAIIDAVEARGWPVRLTLVDLAAYFGAPRIHYTAPELLRRLPEVVVEILRQLYERTEDPALMDAFERPDPAAITYRRRVGMVSAHVVVTLWPPVVSPSEMGGPTPTGPRALKIATYRPAEGPALSSAEGVARAS